MNPLVKKVLGKYSYWRTSLGLKEPKEVKKLLSFPTASNCEAGCQVACHSDPCQPPCSSDDD